MTKASLLIAFDLLLYSKNKLDERINMKYEEVARID